MAILKTLRGQILLICVACLLTGLGALATANYLTARSQAYSQLNAQSRALALSHTDALRDWVRAKAAIVQSSAAVLDEADPARYLNMLQKAGSFHTTYFGYADKRTVFSEPQNLPPDYDPTARPWYQQAAAAQAGILTAPYADAGGAGLVVTFAQAARQGSDVKAVMAGDVSLAAVVANVASIKPTPSSYAFLVGSDGNIIAHPDVKLALKPAAELSPQLSASALAQMARSADLQAMDLQGRAVLLAVAPVEGTGWMLAIALDKAEALSAIGTMLQVSALTGLVVLVVAGALLAGILAQRLRRLTQVRDAMRNIGSGEGDLSRRIDAQGEDELAQIAEGFNSFASKLAGVLVQIRDASGSVRVAAEEIATGNQDLSSRTELTASSLEETTASMQQLTETVRHNADAARQANQMVAQASTVAQRGGQVVGDVVRTMDQINAASRKIEDIIQVIDGIAFQTNILALNAAVEAARAGEQGRGFAVVASEVRALAGRSAGAAKEIKQLIGTSVEQVSNGSRLVHDAGATMSEVVQAVQRVTDIMAEIAASTNEQSTSIAEVGQAVGHLDQMTQQNAALVEESAAAAQSLKDQSVRLTEVVGSFRLAS